MRASETSSVSARKKPGQREQSIESEREENLTGEARRKPNDFFHRAEQALNDILKREALCVDISVFARKDIGILEALVKHLHEEEGLSFAEIARATGRDDRTIWTTYQNAVRKATETGRKEEGLPVPVRVFQRRDVGTLEALVLYLKQAGLGYREIAEILGRSPRTVYTVLWRLKEKVREKETEKEIRDDFEEAAEKTIEEAGEEDEAKRRKLLLAIRALVEAGVEQRTITQALEKARGETRKEEVAESVPVSVFADTEYTVLEALTKYLHEHAGLSIEEISERVRKPPRRIREALRKAETKSRGLRIEKDGLKIPVRAFSQRTLSPLETVAWTLSEQGASYSEIAEALNRPKPTIWTVLRRAEEKLRP